MSGGFFVSEEEIYIHNIGDENCKEGWCGRGYPKKCKCGGLIHADFGDENIDGDYWLYYKCDRCKSTDGDWEEEK